MKRCQSSLSASCSQRCQPLARVPRSRRAVKVRAEYDPEGLFNTRTPEVGIIEKRLRQRMAEQDKEYAAAMLRAQSEVEKAILTRRQARVPPDDPAELVEFMLNTAQEDMEFQAARCRPKFTPEFFKVLDGMIGSERFAPEPDKERLAELEVLRQYLEDISKAVDVAVTRVASAADRLKKLLSSPDKKQMILDMAADNELDQGLMLLLQQNIDAAKEAGQEDAAKFMDKVKSAVSKFVVK